jgi:multiple sugar transport system permease protein
MSASVADRKVKKHKLSTPARMAVFFHTPTFLVLTFITLAPVLYAFYLSFTKYTLSVPGSDKMFAGFDNYIRLFQDGEALSSLYVTIKFVVISVAAQAVLGFSIALVINSLRRGQRLLVSLLMIPMMVAPIVIGLMYSFTLNPQFGLYAYIVNELHLPLSITPLSSSNSALIVICVMDIWEWMPYMVLIFLAGLQSMPTEPFEAAKVDGANSFQTFFKVTLPLMRPVIVVALILRVVDAFKEFDKPYILTGGGPGAATEVVDMFTYNQAFIKYNFSYAATICVVLFAILLFSGIMYGKLVLESGKYEN